MSGMDFSDILVDPLLSDRFSVIRRKEVIDVHGRSTIVATTFPNVVGVVTPISPSDLDRQTDYQKMSRSISVVCSFFLQGEVEGYQPDLVVWRGDQYVVKSIDPYPQFGKGFMQAECTSQDRVDVVFPQTAPTQLAFNVFNNSGYLVTL